MKKILLLPLLLIPFTITGCGLFGGNEKEKSVEEIKIEEPVENTQEHFKELSSNEALIDTIIDGMKSTEYFSDGTYVEDNGNNKVTVYTPKEEVIRDTEGLLKVTDVKIDTLDQNLIFRDGKIVIQDVYGSFDPNDYSDSVKVVKAKERIIEIKKIKTEEIEYTKKEYDKELYDNSFTSRATFIDHAKDSDERVASVISDKLSSIMNELRKEKEEELKKQESEEAKKETVATVPAETVEVPPAETVVIVPTEPQHIHDFKPVYKTVHHEAETHEEKYTVTEPYTIEKKITSYEVYDKNTKEILLNTDDEQEAVDYIADLPEQTAAYRTIISGTTKETEYKEVEKTRTVVDKEAYDEKVIDYYECSCGQRQ